MPVRDPAVITQILDSYYADIGKPREEPAAPRVQADPEQGDFSRGFSKTWPETKQMFGGTVAYFGELAERAGFDEVGPEMQEWGLEVYQSNAREIEGLTRRTDDIYNVQNVADFIDFLQWGAGYVVGQVVEGGGAALAGAAIGSAVPGPGTATGAAAGLVGKTGVKAAVKKFVDGVVQKRIAKGMSEQAARKTLGRDLGAMAGILTNNLTQELGSIYPEALEQARSEGRELTGGDLLRVAGSATGAAALDTWMDKIGLKKIFGGGEGATILRRAAREVPQGMLRESATEVAQTGLERIGAGKYDLTSDEAIHEMVNAGAIGAIGGGMQGSVASLRRGPEAMQRVAQQRQEMNNLLVGLLDGARAAGEARAAQAATGARPALPPPASEPFVVSPQGTAATARQRADIGLTPDVERAAARYPQPSAPPARTPLALPAPGQSVIPMPDLSRTPTPDQAAMRDIGLTPDVQRAQATATRLPERHPVSGPAARDGSLTLEPQGDGTFLLRATPEQVQQLNLKGKGVYARGKGGLVVPARYAPDVQAALNEAAKPAPSAPAAPQQAALAEAAPTTETAVATPAPEARTAKPGWTAAIPQPQTAAAPAEEPAAPATIPAEKVRGKPQYEAALEQMASEAGWFEVGGKLKRTGEGASQEEIDSGRAHQVGEVIGKTKWIPNAPWFAEAQRAAGLPKNQNGEATRAAVAKFLTGKKLSVSETRHVQWLVDYVHGDVEQQRQAIARPYEEMERLWAANHLSDSDLESMLTGDPEEFYAEAADVEREAMDLTMRAREVDPDAVDALSDSLEPEQAIQELRKIIAGGTDREADQQQQDEEQAVRRPARDGEAPAAPAAEESRPELTLSAERAETREPVRPADRPENFRLAPQQRSEEDSDDELRREAAANQQSIPGLPIPEKKSEPAGAQPPAGGLFAKLDERAHEAATSPKNELPEPTEAQKEAGNYKKGHVSIQGLDISIENPKGSRRRPEWPELTAHYGYIRGTVGKDKDHIDVFVGPKPDAQNVYVVDQIKPADGSFDEHKVMLGFESLEAAREGYLSNYSKDWKGLGAITPASIDDFKAWLDGGKTAKPFGKIEAAEAPKADGTPARRAEGVDVAKVQHGVVDVYVSREQLAGDSEQLRLYTADGKPKSGSARRADIKPIDEQASAPKMPSPEEITAHIAEIEQRMAEGDSNADLIPSVRDAAAKSKQAYEAALSDAGWKFDKGANEWRKDGHKLFLRSQGESAAAIVQWTAGKPARARTDETTTAPADVAGKVAAALRSAADAISGASTPARGATEDVGEELWYNRRNASGKGLSWEDIKGLNETLRLREATKTKVWPRPDYEQLVEDGMPVLTAHLVKQAYDALPAKPATARAPTEEDIRLYVETVQRVRDAAFEWARDVASQRGLADRILERVRAQGQRLMGRDDATQGLQGEVSMVDRVFPIPAGADPRYRFRGDFDQARDNNRRALLVGGNKLIESLRPNFYRALDAAKAASEGWPKPREAWQRRFDIRQSPDKAGTWEVVSKAGRGWRRRFAEGLESKEAAEAKAKELAARETKQRFDEEPLELAKLQRAGAPRRAEGENVSSERLREAFGFRGINFGNWMKGDANARERQAHLNHAYDAFHDLAEVMGLPPKAMSLDGLLGIAFGAQGRGGMHAGAAHFVPGVNEINLTRDSGAGSIAHEWGHALDHYFAVKAGGASSADPFLTALLSRPNLTVRPELRGAFKAIDQAMNTRLETAAERDKRIEAQKAGSTKAVERYLTPLRERLERNPAAKDKGVVAKALERFDQLAARIRAGDVGEKVLVRKGRTRFEIDRFLSKAVADVRDLVKDLTGHVPNKDELRWLDIAAGMQKSADEAQDANKAHEPQRVTSSYAREASALDRDKGGQAYWNTPWEKFARAFQSYVLDKLAQHAARNDYLTHPQTSAEGFAALKEMGMAAGDWYPRGAEREAINEAFDKLVATIETVESDKGVGLQSRKYGLPDPGPGLPMAWVQGVVDALTENLPGAPRIHVYERADQLPEDIRGGADEDTEGLFHDGELYIFADAIDTRERAAWVALHELHHAGLAGAYGKELDAVLEQAEGNEFIGRLAEAIRTDRKGKISRLNAVNEAVAELGAALDTGDFDAIKARYDVTVPNSFREGLRGAIGRFIEAIRGILNRLMGVDEFSYEDVRDMLRRARRALGDTRPVEQMGAGLRSQAAPVFYSTLQRVIGQNMAESEPAKQIALKLQGWQQGGKFKAEELEWSGLREWLAQQEGRVTRAQVQDFLRANEIRVEEVVRGAGEADVKAARIRELAGRLEGRGYRIIWDADPVTGEYTMLSAIEKPQRDRRSRSWYPEDQRVDNNWTDEMPAQDADAAEEMLELSREITNGGAAGDVTYQEYTLPGAKEGSYRELLLTLPSRATQKDLEEGEVDYDAEDEQGLAPVRTAADFRSSHFDEPNILAHVRFNERTDADGKRVLFIEEVQSDWHQKGRKQGYAVTPEKLAELKRTFDTVKGAAWKAIERNDQLGFDSMPEAMRSIRSHADWATRWEVSTADRPAIQAYYDAFKAVQHAENGVPDAPFKTTWPMLAFKRALRWAVDNGYDRIAWTTGEQQADRYDLSKHVDEVEAFKSPSGKVSITAKKGGSVVMREEGLAPEKVADVIGKDLADKINAQQYPDEKRKTYSGLDLKVGGEGMKGFYDEILPREVGKYVKKWGGKVGRTMLLGASKEPRFGKLNDDGSHSLAPDTEVHSLDVTPAMRESVAAGQPLFSKRPGGASKSWDAPEPSRLDNVIYTLQDKHIDTKRVVEAVAKAGKLTDATDPHLQEELYHKRAAKVTEDFLTDELNPLLKEMHLRGVKVGELEEYLHNRHAKERNEHIATINEDMPDGGSGIDTADAEKYLAGLKPQKRHMLEQLAKRVDAMTKATRQMLVDYGLESQETVQAWSSTYQHYIPLFREDADHGHHGTGQGYSVKGPSSKRAVGSKRKVVDILANITMQRERAITRGEKNRVAAALVGLAQTNPNPDFWKVDQPPMKKRVDERTGLVVTAADPLYKLRDNVVVARIPNADGDVVEHAVIFEESDPRAMRMALALKNLDLDDMGHVLGLAATVTQYFAKVNTQWNPIFGVINLTRDVQGALLNLSTTPIAGKQAEVLKHTLSALRGIYIDVREVRKGQHPKSSWAQEWEEFQREGGSTGYRDLFHTSKERALAIERELTKLGEGDFKRKARAVFDWLSDYNTAMENAIRLAAYRVAKQNGMTNQRAASLAKNLTVNFNKKGQISTQAGALWAFFNASVQGSARLAQTLAGPAGKKIIQGGLLLGSLQALALAAAGFDDDEPPEFVRERNLIVPLKLLTGRQDYITIPMPLGFHVIPTLSRVATEYALSGFRDGPERLASLFGTVTEAFNPMGSAGLSLQTIAPTAIDPLAALAENRDWTGRQIAVEDMSKLSPTPGHARARDTATSYARFLSRTANMLSGGTEFKPGVFSPTPDQIDYLIGQATGGVGREAAKLEQTLTSGVTGEDLPPHKVPLLGRFYGSAEGQAAEGNQFYRNLRELNEHEAEIKGRQKTRGDVLGYIADNPEAKLVRMANSTERRVSELRRRKREMLARGAPPTSIKTIDSMITAQMKLLNERVEAVRAGE